MYTKKIKMTTDKRDIACFTMRERCITILYHTIENCGQCNQCDIGAANDGKVGCITTEKTMAFLYSDWLYFL